jgi:hypothetical protein
MSDLAELFEIDPRPDPCDPGMEVVHTDDRVLWHRPTATRNPWASGVLWTRFSAANAERGIDEVLEYFSKRRTGFTWTIRPDTTPNDLATRLEARGLLVEARTYWLAARLPIAGLRTNPDIVVREVDGAEGMRHSIEVEHPDWVDARRALLLEERLAYVGCRGRRRHFAVAYLGGQAISAARWRLDSHRRAIHLSGAETLPEFRRRGAYSTLVDFRARTALEHGLRYATINADETTSAPILMKRGFISAGRATIYLAPEVLVSSS